MRLAAFCDDVLIFDQHERLLELLQLVRPAAESSAEGRHLHVFLLKRPPATAAKVATAANVAAMPTSIGSPLRKNGWSARANTKGSTGRIQGLTIVSTPPK